MPIDVLLLPHMKKYLDRKIGEKKCLGWEKEDLLVQIEIMI